MQSLGTCSTLSKIPISSSFTFPILATLLKDPSAFYNFLLLGEEIYEIKFEEFGVIWSVAPESRIQGMST